MRARAPVLAVFLLFFDRHDPRDALFSLHVRSPAPWAGWRSQSHYGRSAGLPVRKSGPSRPARRNLHL